MRFLKVLTAIGVVAITSVSFSPAYAAQKDAPKAPKTAKVNAAKPDKASKTPKAPKSDIAQKIASKPQHAAKVQTLVPAGMTLEDAAAGFKNQGQFIAALHVSRNHDIPFDQLKAMMTGPDQKSLG